MSSMLPSGSQINLQLGWPSPTLFPAEELNKCTTEILTDAGNAREAYVYGTSRGYAPLRKGIARWLGKLYRNDENSIDEGRICVAGGASQHLSNILLRFTDPSYTRNVWMVEPTYFLACPIMEDCGFIGRLRGVPEDDEGIDLIFLKSALDDAEAQWVKNGGSSNPTLKTPANGYPKMYKHVIYVVPTFSNPSSKTMSLQHRRDLVKLAIDYDALVVSDDVYDFLYWPEQKGQSFDKTKSPVPPRLVDVNYELAPESEWGNTVSNGSFSKIVAPGVRLSWSEATPAFSNVLASTGASVSGGNPAHLSAVFVERLLSSGALERHISNVLIPTYEKRYHAMVGAIKEHLEPLGVRITIGKPYSDSKTDGKNIMGGFFLLVTLPKATLSTPALAKLALDKYELKFAHGIMFVVKGDAESKRRCDHGYERTVRLCWAYHEEKEIIDGIVRMRDLLVDNR
ncbi:pyridoxal phosphate-dependent transferase [Xylariaceae sp. FL1272]|nr:pyridoxal phosphate-dependent transferase [Xylariaceae sp. FL1272]